MPHPNTEPFEQLLSEEEVEATKRKRQRHQRGKRYEQDRSEQTSSHSRPEGPFRDFAEPVPYPSHGNSMLKTALDFLIPPKDARPEDVRRWRIAIGLSSFVFFFHIATACGLMGSLGLSGFALASDVNEIKVELLEQRIFEARVRQCTAQSVESRQFYAGKVQELLRKYHETARVQYPQLPTCAEIQ